MLTILPVRDFPSLSNNSQLNASQATMWSNAGSRNLSGPVQRNQSTPVSGPTAGQDDLFAATSSRMPPHQGSFRSRGPESKSAACQSFLASLECPSPLVRAGFGPQNPSSTHVQSHRGNGLLNALSANNRANEARTPPGVSTSDSPRGGQEGKRADESRLKPLSFRDGNMSRSTHVAADSSAQATDGRTHLGAIGNEGSVAKSKDDKVNQLPESVDPLSGMAAVDKWGIKGLRTLMNNHPDFHAMVVGMDPNTLGLDLSNQE
ncbi:hypothetical protein CDD82_6053 [Ophiocordyceps australis]|uniref:NOT2/NOT3/NOT5 C-terminal domain-containing protein n=1 Tax=Ophiocordyceps australis TaxID=1399860 RepID=A0A2C5XH76_9HYPO|nr:hypothetical protein CDD82_6053 [Ophiocordyceps australis]